MRPTFPRPRPATRRRGFTLLEMLVAVALLILMMTVIVSIFAAATGAVTTQRTMQELDGKLRQLDSVIRQDLQGATARFTPPLDPSKNLGYFELGENAFADNHGEDTDDYVRLTVKAPDGQPFTGRVYLGIQGQSTPQFFANLAPAQQALFLATQPVTVTSQFAEVIYFLRASNLYRRVLLVAPEMQGAVSANFLGPLGNSSFFSARIQDPTGKFVNTPIAGFNCIPLSWQGVNDLSAHPSPVGLGAAPILNTLGNLSNRENRAFNMRFASDFATNGTGAAGPDGLSDDENTNGNTVVGDGLPDYVPGMYGGIFGSSNPVVFEFGSPARNTTGMAFPYLYLGAFSNPSPGLGIHSLDPSGKSFNHAPLSEGDNLPVPTSPQTWWGFPTWRETLSALWNDPLISPNAGLATSSTTLLPPVLNQPFNDGLGSGAFTSSGGALAFNPALWDDDLVMTNVRSFDVKAYDNAFPGYVDLGWGDDPRTPWLAGDSPGAGLNFSAQTPPAMKFQGIAYDTLASSFAHEGRMPPLVNDGRFDFQFGQVPAGSYANVPPGANAYTGNLGDNNAAVVRLLRVWDSWSTDYARAPSYGYNPGFPAASVGTPIGPPFSPPIYPSYPPPYQQPLRGIQIQIRVVDPRNERIKVLTIRQDFSDKL